MRTPHRSVPTVAPATAFEDHLGRPIAGACLPDVAQPAEAMLDALETALERREEARICALVVDYVRVGHRPDGLVRRLAAWIAARPHGLLDPALGVLVEAAKLAPHLEDLRPALAWAQAACLAAERLGGRPVEPEVPPADHATGLDELAALVVARRGVEAQAWVGKALADGSDPLGIEATLLGLACRHPGDGGVVAITVQRLMDLRPLAGEAGLQPLLGRLARALAERPERQAFSVAHAQRIQALADRLPVLAQAADPDKGKLFAEPKFRVHLLDGKTEDAALRATVRALEVGIPPGLIAGSLELAAAERLLRFDSGWDQDDSVVEGRADVEQLVLLAAAVRQLRPLVPARDWLELLLFAVGLLHASAAMDAPERDRKPLPEPEAVHQTWDHGPEIAKIVGALQAGDGERAIAVLRAYFLLVLPEQPLALALAEAAMTDRPASAGDQARAIATMGAAIGAFHALAGHPHRELPLCAALRSLAAPRTSRTAFRSAQAVLQARDTGWQPRRLVGAGPKAHGQ